MHDRVKPKHYRTIIREYSLENSYQNSDESVETVENLNFLSVAKNSTNSSGDGSLAIEPSARTRSSKGNRPRYQKRESISGTVAAVQQLARSLNILNNDFYAFRKEQNERMHNITKLLDRFTTKSRKAEKERKKDSRRNSSKNKQYKSRTEDVTDTKDQNHITNNTDNKILNNTHNETFNNTQNKEELDQEPIKSKTHTQTDTNPIHTIQNNTDKKVLNNTDKEELEQKHNKGRTLTEIDTNTKPIHKNITQSKDTSNDFGNALKIHQTVPKQAPKASEKDDLHDIPPTLRHLPFHKVTIYRAQRKKNISIVIS
ncbi:putative mediator of RNA polymerase II transcription subunit 29 [Drosophila miranda]|uniref:putative mediator of RNA polymerase II transcription subunit 29 n=1 Tax=Drosophila miranda TaxID=7229 RepID=UPI00143F9808|nr:putative mediator of RNA polymerase II transcription subunit 29 [Drosophila miranda]